MRKDSQKQREKILDHLLDLLVEQGIAALTVRKLAARSGVAIGTVQYYFPTKPQMVRAATEHALLQAKQLLQVQTTNELSVKEQLSAFAHMLVPKTADDRTAHVWLEVAALAALHPEVAGEHAAFWQVVENALTELIIAIPEVTSENARDMATQLLALLDGLTIAVLTETDRMTPERAHNTVDHWLHAILP